MNLVKELWNEKDSMYFTAYLESLKEDNKIERTKNIINTNMDVLAIPTPKLRKITSEIKKGNFLSFLDLNMNKYYENIAINGFLISNIEKFEIMKSYLDHYSTLVDNWALCDLLKFKIKGSEEKFYQLAIEYIKSSLPFRRRIAIILLFSFIENDDYLEKIYFILNQLNDEQEYYVNMAAAWLCCECFIKRRNETLEFLENHNLNNFTINKFVSKCRDSYRVSLIDKDFLLKFIIKN